MSIFHPDLELRMWNYRIYVEVIPMGGIGNNDCIEVNLGIPDTLHQHLQSGETKQLQLVTKGESASNASI